MSKSGKEFSFDDISCGDLQGIVNEIEFDDLDNTSELLLFLLEGVVDGKASSIDIFSALEILRPAVMNLFEINFVVYCDDQIPFSNEQLKVVSVNLGLLDLLRKGYLIKVRTLLEMEDNGSAEMIQATKRYFYISGLFLMECFRVYMVPPEGVWLDINSLFSDACDLGIETAHLKDDKSGCGSELSIKQSYLRIVLMFMFNPFHLLRNEVERLFDRCGRWASFVKVSKGEGREGFFSALEEDRGPFYITEITDDLRETSIYIDIDGMVKILDNQILSISTEIERLDRDNIASQKNELGMYKRLRAALRPRLQRGSERVPVFQQLNVTEGIRQGYAAFGGIGEHQVITEDDSDNMLSDLSDAVIWNQDNESEEGIALSCTYPAQMPVDVGRIIFFNSENSDSWSVGGVRWLRSFPDGGAEFGVKVFSASGVAARVAEGERSSLAVMVPDVDPFKSAATLLIERNIFEVGAVVVVNMAEHSIAVKLMGMIEVTEFYERYSMIALHEINQSSLG
ncbi:MAG: hypothetical protein D6B27_09270 [Gammaproteobacteria bacterium]|nr:MAG: hypothetical protein D6B27_09270 [Gammaproteobacteria bacterium]